MRSTRTVLALVLALFLFGCASEDELRFDTTKRNPVKTVDLYHFDSGTPKPDKGFKVIAALHFLGPRQDEPKARKYFLSRSKKLGADGIIMDRPEPIGSSGNPYGFSGSFYFNAKVIVYIQP